MCRCVTGGWECSRQVDSGCVLALLGSGRWVREVVGTGKRRGGGTVLELSLPSTLGKSSPPGRERGGSKGKKREAYLLSGFYKPVNVLRSE